MGCAASSDANSNRIKPNPETSTYTTTSRKSRPSRQLEKSLRQTMEMSKPVLPPHPNTPPLFNTTQTTNKQNNTTHSNIPPHPNTPPNTIKTNTKPPERRLSVMAHAIMATMPDSDNRPTTAPIVTGNTTESPVSRPTTAPNRIETSTPDNSSEDSIAMTVTDYNPNLFLEWKATKKCQRYHWWPLKETYQNTPDPRNNLFATGGGLEKYDKIFGTNSVKYQRDNHCISIDSTRSDKNWAGYCDRAAMLSCLYEYPKYNVVIKVGDKEEVFTPRDIECLLIIAAENTTRQGLSVFYGSRNNMKNKIRAENNKFKGLQERVRSEPFPLELMEILTRFSRESEPFVMDIDNGAPVWNYSYDSFKIEKVYINPIECDIPKEGDTEFYNFQIKSSAYPKKNMNIIGYVNRYNELIRQGWIGKVNPDFLWKDYAIQGPWTGRCEINPHIDAYRVYMIYQKSLKSDPTPLVFPSV